MRVPVLRKRVAAILQTLNRCYPQLCTAEAADRELVIKMAHTSQALRAWYSRILNKCSYTTASSDNSWKVRADTLTSAAGLAPRCALTPHTCTDRLHRFGRHG